MENPEKNSQGINGRTVVDCADASCDTKTERMPPVSWNQDTAKLFFSQMTELYSVRSARLDALAWERLLMAQPLQDPDQRCSAGLSVLDFFIKHPYLTHEIWVLYNAFFGWTAMETVAPPSIKTAIHTVSHEVDEAYFMNFDHIPDNDNSEKYLSYRRSMRDAAIDDKRDDVRRYYELALNLCASDPELYRVAFQYYNGLKHWEQTSTITSYAWEVLTRYLSLCPDNLELEILKAEYLLKRGFDTETLNEFKAISKKYPLRLSVLYKRMECFLVLRDQAGAALERNTIRSSYSRVQKQLERDRMQAEDKEEIDRLLAENKGVLEELNSKYPQSQLSPADIRRKPYFKILVALAAILLLAGLYLAFTGLKSLISGSTPGVEVYVPDETVPEEVSEALLSFAMSLQTRYPNDIFSYSMKYDRYGYMEFSLQSMQKFDKNTQKKILMDISNFVATRKITFSEEYTPVLWKVQFMQNESQEIVYYSNPAKISQNKQNDVQEIWSNQKFL
jgi:hypothetical protein